MITIHTFSSERRREMIAELAHSEAIRDRSLAGLLILYGKPEDAKELLKAARRSERLSAKFRTPVNTKRHK